MSLRILSFVYTLFGHIGRTEDSADAKRILAVPLLEDWIGYWFQRTDERLGIPLPFPITGSL